MLMSPPPPFFLLLLVLSFAFSWLNILRSNTQASSSWILCILQTNKLSLNVSRRSLSCARRTQKLKYNFNNKDQPQFYEICPSAGPFILLRADYCMLWPGKSSSTISGCGCLLWFRLRSWGEEKIQMWRDVFVAILLEIRTIVLPSHKVCPFQLGRHPSQRFPQTSVLLCKISKTQWLNCLLSTEVIWGMYGLNTTLLYLFSCLQADQNKKMRLK